MLLEIDPKCDCQRAKDNWNKLDGTKTAWDILPSKIKALLYQAEIEKPDEFHTM